MAKNLPLTDFRALRSKLEPHEYMTGGEDIPPSELVDPDVWDGIMHLPEDVSVRISAAFDDASALGRLGGSHRRPK
jgi:hypothetical protein